MRLSKKTLKWPLVIQPLLFHFAILFISFPIIVAVATRLDSGGPYTDETITPIIAKAIDRDEDGRLTVRMTDDLKALKAESPNLWFIAQDESNNWVSFGPLPVEYDALKGMINGVSYGHLRGRSSPYLLSAVIRREDSPAGPLTIMGHGKLSTLGFTVIAASTLTALPIFIVMALVSLAVVPLIVRRSIAGVARIADEAQRIDVDRRGMRLSQEQVPAEIEPLVSAVNDALKRLDEGYESQRRFIASAAHELRTPIAILRLKIDAAQDPSLRKLSCDIDRLSTLAEQMLDIQRVETSSNQQKLDLAQLVRQVAADLAPLLIAAGRSIEVKTDHAQPILGDAGAIERVVTNLIQNAVHHGGRHVTVRVQGSTFEVEDDGPGIPAEARDRVFEPFYRLQPKSTGSGLGLHLVKEVVERHGGQVRLLGAPDIGTIARVTFPEIH